MTEKTNIDDIIGIVKTEEKTDSVELKKEYYKNQSKDKHYTYLNYSRDGYIGSFYENDKPLTSKEVWDILKEQEEEIQSLKERKESLHKTIASLDECQKGQSHHINQLVKENKQLKQQCLDFMEMLDDMSIAYLLNEELEYILGLTDYDKWVKKQTKRGKEL